VDQASSVVVEEADARGFSTRKVMMSSKGSARTPAFLCPNYLASARDWTRRWLSFVTALSPPANQWIIELNRSSDLFIYLLNNGQAEFTDEQFADYVGRIAFWFERGLAVCSSRHV
jgi:hypothetical protein